MDESWRTPLGPISTRRRSTDEVSRRRRASRQDSTLDPDDFRDVFGGPPRTVLLRRFSGDNHSGGDPRPTTFYDEIFRPAAPARGRAGRRLPGLSIPGSVTGAGVMKTDEGFYDDIFGVGGGGGGWDRQRSRSDRKWRSNSSSVVSSEGESPLRRSIGEDAMLASFTSKLRPITIPSRQPDSSPPSTASGGEEQSSHRTLTIPCRTACTFINFQDTNPTRPHRAHITISDTAAGVNSPASSPSSVISQAFMHPLRMKTRAGDRWERIEREQEKVVVEVDEGGAGGSSFVIDMERRGNGETEGPAAIDDAIAWAKGKFCWTGVEDGHEKVTTTMEGREDNGDVFMQIK